MPILKRFLISTFITLSLYAFAEDGRIMEFNQRAAESLNSDPSTAIYYADKSLDVNKEGSNRDEFINSNFIKAQSYGLISDRYLQGIIYTDAYKIITTEGYFYKNSNFYTSYGDYLLEVGQFTELETLVTNKQLNKILDKESKLYFNLLKIKKDIFFDEKDIEDEINRSITESIEIKANNILGDLYIIYGDFNLDSNLDLAKNHYQKALELGLDTISAKALLKLGYVNIQENSPYKGVNYLKRAFLSAEAIDDNKLTLEILTTLAEGYRQIGDFKNLSLTKERLNFIEKKKSDFILKEQREILEDNFLIERLTTDLAIANKKLSSSKLFNLLIGTILFFLIIILSIQQYKIRAYHIGEH